MGAWSRTQDCCGYITSPHVCSCFFDLQWGKFQLVNLLFSEVFFNFFPAGLLLQSSALTPASPRPPPLLGLPALCSSPGCLLHAQFPTESSFRSLQHPLSCSSGRPNPSWVAPPQSVTSVHPTSHHSSLSLSTLQLAKTELV